MLLHSYVFSLLNIDYFVNTNAVPSVPSLSEIIDINALSGETDFTISAFAINLGLWEETSEGDFQRVSIWNQCEIKQGEEIEELGEKGEGGGIVTDRSNFELNFLEVVFGLECF